MRSVGQSNLILAALLGGAVLIVGCSAPEAPPTTTAIGIDDQVSKTLDWLERLPPAERQATIAKAPQIKTLLEKSSDPALKSRIQALGIL